MSSGQDGWYASWKQGKVTDSITFCSTFWRAVAKWPDQPEVKAHYTKSIEPFGDWWKQSNIKHPFMLLQGKCTAMVICTVHTETTITGPPYVTVKMVAAAKALHSSQKDTWSLFWLPWLLQSSMSTPKSFCNVLHRGFAWRGTLLYAHDFALLLGFLFVWRDGEKQQNLLLLLIYFIAKFEILTECVF